MKILIKIIGLLFLIIGVTQHVSAATPNSLFSSHAVLQQKVVLPVWGMGRNGERVKVNFNGQQVETTVKNHRWEVRLKPMKAGGPYTMNIESDTLITLNDMYIGEVWVCGGQSNMGRKMGPSPRLQPITDYENEKIHANYPLIRQYKVSYAQSDTLVSDAQSNWVVCSSKTIDDFSAVAYFFARDLQKSIHVPVGIILSSVGGTEAKLWVSRLTLKSHPLFSPMVQRYDSALKQFPTILEEFNTHKIRIMEQFTSDSLRAKNEKTTMPKRPVTPKNPSERRRVSCYYNGMIAPLQKFPVKGFTWYQGESDRDSSQLYAALFPELIKDWRATWKLGDIPFLFVQIAPYLKNTPELREAQLQTLNNTVNTAMIVTTDCGDRNDIHPPHKQPVGYRLALAARAVAYHEKIEYSGPVYKSFKVIRNKIEIRFSHAAKSLVCDSSKILKGFTISGTDKKFVPATALIRGSKIIVFNDSIKTPIAVHYGWDNVPDGNLYNVEKLPASPFRTDFIY